MKSFFSRLHDTQTGHSKSAATRDSYKFWIPNVDPDRESAKPISTHENVLKIPTSRPRGEKRSSSRTAKPSQPIPMPAYDRPIPSTSAAISGQTTEYIRPNLGNQYYPQPPTKVTSTRTRDYDDGKPQPPPRPPSRPPYPGRPTIPQDNPVKSSRHGNMRSESAAATQHQVWIPAIAPSTSRQPEEPKKPVQEGDEALERFRSRYDENDRPLESGRRDRDRAKDREREKPRERDGERDRARQEKGRDLDRERERERIKARDRDRERDRAREREQELAKEAEKDQERTKEQEREKEREREREREKEKERDRVEREKEREREREKERERLEREKERERLERERERDREREREKERERFEREREREREKHRDRERAARHAERERREREKEKERTRAREREWEQKVKDRENEANRESPIAKGKERAREERTATWDQPERPSGDATRPNVRTQDRDFRKDRETRTTRDPQNYRSRDRDRDQLKYRAEATDGEQDLRRSKPRVADRDKRKDANQGWVSDNFAAHERRPSRTALNPEPTPIEEGESSDGSLRLKQGVRTMQRRTRIEDGMVSTKAQVPRSRQDRPPDFRNSLLPPNYPQAVAHPVVVSETQAPITSTPLNMPVHLPSRDTKTAAEGPSQQFSNAPVINELPEAPVRREINRLKLNEPPSLPAESAPKSTEHLSSLSYRRPPSHIPSTPYFVVSPQAINSHPSRNDYSMPPMRQSQPPISMTQTNSNPYSDPVKEGVSRSDWTKDQRLHSERPLEPSLPSRTEPPLVPLGRLNIEHTLSSQPAMQDKPIIDPSSRQTSMVPSEGYSRSRLNSLSNKPELFPSSHQNASASPYPTSTATQDRTIVDLASKQTPMIPSEGYVRSRLNSLSTKPDPFPSTHQNVTIPVYFTTVDQSSAPVSYFPVVDWKEAQNKDLRSKAEHEILSPPLPAEHMIESKRPLPRKQEVATDPITSQNHHPQFSLTQINDSRPSSRAQYVTPLQAVPIQPVQVPETSMVYNGLSIQRPPTASGYKDGSRQHMPNVLPSASLSTESPISAQVPPNAQSQVKPPDIQSSSNALNNRHLSEVQVNVNGAPSVYQLQNPLELPTSAPRFPPSDGHPRPQEQGGQEKAGISIPRPSTSFRQDNGRTLRHPGASITNSTMYPETIQVLPSIRPSETIVVDPTQVGSSVSGNTPTRIENSTSQATLNMASNLPRLATSESYTRATDSNDQSRHDMPISGPSATAVPRQDHVKILRHQEPSISTSNANPETFQELTDSQPGFTRAMNHQASSTGQVQTHVNDFNLHSNTHSAGYATFPARLPLSEGQPRVHDSDDQARLSIHATLLLPSTGVNHDNTKANLDQGSSPMFLSPKEDVYQAPKAQHSSHVQQGFVNLRADDSPGRKRHHLGVTFQTPKTPKDDSSRTFIGIDTVSQPTMTYTRSLGYTQKNDSSESTNSRAVSHTIPSSVIEPTPAPNFKQESPTVRNRNVASTPKAETSSLQMPASWNVKQDSPRATQHTFATPGIGHQSLPSVNPENAPQRQKRDSRQDSPRTRTENRPSGSPTKSTALSIAQISLPLVTEPVVKLESPNVQPEKKESFIGQVPGIGFSGDHLPKFTEIGVASGGFVPQLRIPEISADNLPKPSDGGTTGGSFAAQLGIPVVSVDRLAKPTESGMANGSLVPQLRIPKSIPSSGPKFDPGLHAVHSTPRVPPLSLNTEPALHAPPLSAKISSSKAIDPFLNQLENTRPQTPHANLNQEAFPARRADLKPLLASQMGGTPKQPVQPLGWPHAPSAHYRSSSGSKQEATIDNETPSLGFFSSTFSSALNAPVDKGDAHLSKTLYANDRMKPDVRPGKLHIDTGDHVKQANTTKSLDAQHAIRDVQSSSRPDGEQRETSRSHRPPDVVKKEVEIEQPAFLPSGPFHTPFTHPVLAEILSSPPTKSLPIARNQSAVPSEYVSDADRRVGISFNGNTDVPKVYNPTPERSQIIPESTRPPVPRRHGSFQAMPIEPPTSSKEHLVQENRAYVPRASNIPQVYQVTQGGKEPPYPTPVLPPSRLPSSSHPVTGPFPNSDGSTREPVAHESRVYTAKTASLLQVNQGGRDYSYPGPTLPPTRAPSSSIPPTGAYPASMKQETIPLADTNPVRSSVVRSGLETGHMGPSSYDKRGYILPSSALSQLPNENRGLLSEGHPSQRIFVPATTDSRPPPVLQVPQSSHPASYPSNRHQHSVSLPVSFAPAPVTNPPKKEDPAPVHSRPTTHRTTSHYQTTFTPFQSSTFPVNVPATDASIVSLPHAPSEETILMTPSSLARSMMLKPTTSRQSVTPSVASQTDKKGGIFSMFRRAPTPASAPTPQYEIWHPNVAVNTPESSPGHAKATHTPHEPQVEPPSPKRIHSSVEFSIPVPIHGQSERKPSHSHSHVFTPFKYLTTKRNRAISVASLEAQDGTAPNTVVGSPTASMHSQAPILPPPVRDPWQATHEWRNKEEADAKARAKAKLRRQPPGVVFDVGEEVPDEGHKRPRRMRTKYRSSTSTRQATAEPAPQT